MTISLKAHQVLILEQLSFYEEGLIQMEAILKASVTSNVYGEQVAGSRCVHICFLLHICLASPLKRFRRHFT